MIDRKLLAQVTGGSRVTMKSAVDWQALQTGLTSVKSTIDSYASSSANQMNPTLMMAMAMMMRR